MAKISELPAAPSISGSDILVVVVDEGGGELATKRTTVADVAALSEGSPAGTGNEVQYRGDDGMPAAIPGVEGSDEGLSIGGTALRTSGGVAMQYDPVSGILTIGADKLAANAHNIVAIKAIMGLFLDAPMLALKATQIVAMGDLNHPVNGFVGSVLVPDEDPVYVPIWPEDQIAPNGTVTAVAKVVATSNVTSAEFDLHAKWRKTLPGSQTLVARSVEDEDSDNADGVTASFVEHDGSLCLCITGSAAGSVRVGYEVDMWMVTAP